MFQWSILETLQGNTVLPVYWDMQKDISIETEHASGMQRAVIVA